MEPKTEVVRLVKGPGVSGDAEWLVPRKNEDRTGPTEFGQRVLSASFKVCRGLAGSTRLE